ncbi:MAG: RNA polymerase factor sigma-54 [endosymbiont of Galathealinum brachiosum]|uniref:RNA polymerase sigma-54 factor n=1 Tax=endosymbiont of Galathealinum brachiosum TaxID=2200906 RepID=A0A370D9W9_9GAMM|nr:MAG: RNA polymerase factor sigma-54 [endosymbiont of Galathealinum brachiosum]
MKQSLQLRIGQSLTMTPQLQQAIRLLQLSTLELQTEIQEVLESNPMLEVEEDHTTSDPLEDNKQKTDDNNDNQQDSTEGLETTDLQNDAAAQDVDLNTQEMPDELPVDSQWDDVYEPAMSTSATPSGDDDKAREFLENQSSSDGRLVDHLLDQLLVTNMSDVDRTIALAIIDGIDEDGYLQESAEEIHSGLVNDLEIELDEVEAVLHLIQHFDPVGVAARDLKECLLLQMERFSTEDYPVLKKARQIIKDHLDLLGNHDYAKLKRYNRITDDELADIIRFIQSLNPKPGGNISRSSTQYVVPDVFVTKSNGRWNVRLNGETAPKLRINPTYASYIQRGKQSDDNTFMKNNMQEARWFIKSLQSRNETLMRVATSIVEHQRTFLDYGEEGMKPLVLREIAEELELHESTISRVTTQKYMHTPKGVFEFKYFFSSHVGTSDGGECSATAIRAMIKKLVEGEEPRKPLSDNKIANLLVDQGINVARRTVAKYREAMMIPPSNERKRLA